MTDTLAISIGADGIAAALGSGEPPQPTLVTLGASGVTTASAVAAGADGAVLVGDAAADAPGPVVTDPLERAARGRPGALAAVITHVVGRAAAASGRAPDRLALVVPDDFAAVERDNVVVAANNAGFTDVSLVPASLAESRGGDATASVRAAVGAAVIGSFDAPPPIVTREDLGQLVDPSEPTSAPPAGDGPVSVFDEDPEPALPPVRETPEPVAAPPARPQPARPAPAPAGMVAPPPLQPIPDRGVPLVPVLALLGMALLALVIFVATRGGDSDTVAPAETTTTTAVTTTTDAPTTTSTPEATTSSSTTTSTTSSSTSSTSSTSTTTTTTTPVRVAEPGPVTLAETGLAFDTGVVVRFGQDLETVQAAIEAVLGGPDADTGETENDFCAGSVARFMRWGNLELVFTNAGTDDSPLRFSQWFADGHLEPTGLVTPEGLGESATVGFLEVTFPGALVIVPAFEDDIVGIFAVTNPQTGAVLNGTTLGLDPEGVVTSLWAGDSCSRVFT